MIKTRATFKPEEFSRILIYNDFILLEQQYPELIPYKENLFNVFHFFVYNDLILSSDNSYFDIYRFTLTFCRITKNKEFKVNHHTFKLLGDPRYRYLPLYVDYAILLQHTEDMINNSLQDYNDRFEDLVADIYTRNKRINKDDFIDNPKYYNLITMVETIKKEYNDIYNMSTSYRMIITFIASYCYYRNIGYDLVYNCAKDPEAYLFKLMCENLMGFSEYESFHWLVGGREKAFERAQGIFSNKKAIM